MAIVTTVPQSPAKLRKSGIKATLAPWEFGGVQATSNMPLLRSLSDLAARVAINMSLLTELIASPQPPFHCVLGIKNILNYH
jgi:hypothetical protein